MTTAIEPGLHNSAYPNQPHLAASQVPRRHHLAGRPSNGRHTPKNFADRFWRRVDRSGGPGACWPWLGGKIKATGRGQVHLWYDENGKNVRRYAPGVAWELTNGPIPEGLKPLHNCPAGDDPGCCNPTHLFLGTQADNVKDCVLKGRRNAFGRQKLHPPQVREIRQLAKTGLSQRQIAARFGVARNTVSQIVTRTTWGHLNDHPALDVVFERVPSAQLQVRGEVA